MNPITEGETEEEHHPEMKKKENQKKERREEKKKKPNQFLTPPETETNKKHILSTNVSNETTEYEPYN